MSLFDKFLRVIHGSIITRTAKTTGEVYHGHPWGQGLETRLAPDLYRKVNALIKRLRNKKEFMGGMQVIVTGDFFQLPPVVIEANRTCYECDFNTKREYLPPDDEMVLSLDPYLETVGVSNIDWTTCSRTHPRTGRICGHIWNPTMRYAYQTLDWLEANFKDFTLTKVYRQKDQQWIDMLAKIKKGEGFQDGKITAVLDGLKRPLPTLPSGLWTLEPTFKA
ncbi:hypothetical protein BGX38DRAFT_399931 [Terfezia claveryi]|nr:hypothetical protein BGX38DRAFT_399931 [Terfezia claveryi]